MAEPKTETKKRTPKAPKTEQPAPVAQKAGEGVSASSFRTHGRTFTGIVVSDKMSKTVTVAWERRHYVAKYQRYERRYSKVKAHNPAEIDAHTGDTVTVMETRPISKTKNFIVIKKQ